MGGGLRARCLAGHQAACAQAASGSGTAPAIGGTPRRGPSARAGYGKTVLLADWARRGQRPVAWLSLDVGDNDPARFWRHGVAALDQGRPGLAERVGPLLGPP